MVLGLDQSDVQLRLNRLPDRRVTELEGVLDCAERIGDLYLVVSAVRLGGDVAGAECSPDGEQSA
ncbi:hypothetical protein [Blastococcus sp. SYSU DS0541]